MLKRWKKRERTKGKKPIMSLWRDYIQVEISLPTQLN